VLDCRRGLFLTMDGLQNPVGTAKSTKRRGEKRKKGAAHKRDRFQKNLDNTGSKAE